MSLRHRVLRCWAPLLALVIPACEPRGVPLDASGDGMEGACPELGWGAGRHRLFVQGHEAPPAPDGTWPFLHTPAAHGTAADLCDDGVFTDDPNGDGIYQIGETPRSLGPPGIVHGEHFVVGAGSYVEIAITLCDDITGDVTFYVPNFDQEGSVALHQLLVVHEGAETLIGEVTDDEPGFSGYNPFVRVVSGVDPAAFRGDRLVLRSTNLSGLPFSVMVWRPPSEYESWIVVEVP